MEWLVIGLSSFLGLIAPVGVVGDRLIEQQIRKRVHRVEALTVQVTAVPTYKLAQGQIDQLRLSATGLSPFQDVRLEKLELETDSIVLKSLKKTKLARPLNLGAHIILTEADLNRAIAAPKIAAKLRNLEFEAFPGAKQSEYSFSNVIFDLQPNRQIKIRADLTEKGYSEILKLELQAKLELKADRSAIHLTQLTATADGQPMPPTIVSAFTKAIDRTLDLTQLEKRQITARMVQLETTDSGLDLAAIVQIRP
jgi:LmeA-like phospholipid-binding